MGHSVTMKICHRLDSVISEIFPNLRNSVISYTKTDKIRSGDS